MAMKSKSIMWKAYKTTTSRDVSSKSLMLHGLYESMYGVLSQRKTR